MSASQNSFSTLFRIVTAGLAVGGVVVGLRFWLWGGRPPILSEQLSRQGIPSASPSLTQAPSIVPAIPKKRSPSAPPSAGSTSQVDHEGKKDLKGKWQQFTQKFGPDLEPQYNSDGQLISVRGVLGQGVAADTHFRTQDLQKITLRGQEIVSAAQDLLGLRAELPLSNPIPQGGPVTAQLYFRETYHGLILLPEGNLKIDLGPKGEILGLDSDYLSKIDIISDVRLTSKEAFAKALSSMDRGKSFPIPTNPVMRSSEGNKVVWVTQATQGHVAYQFFIHGREVVVDAGTGKVLSSKNRKQE